MSYFHKTIKDVYLGEFISHNTQRAKPLTPGPVQIWPPTYTKANNLPAGELLSPSCGSLRSYQRASKWEACLPIPGVNRAFMTPSFVSRRRCFSGRARSSFQSWLPGLTRGCVSPSCHYTVSARPSSLPPPHRPYWPADVRAAINVNIVKYWIGAIDRACGVTRRHCHSA